MSKDKICKLKFMYWFNIFITGGFALIILIFAFSPSLRNLLAWQGTDPIIVSLIVPLFFIIAIYCIRFLSKPKEGILLLKIQVFYKPLSIKIIMETIINVDNIAIKSYIVNKNNNGNNCY